MDTPVEVTFRNITPRPDIETLVRREAVELERYGRRLVSCRVAIEEPQRHPRAGNRYRVRVEIGAGLARPIVVTRELGETGMHRELGTPDAAYGLLRALDGRAPRRPARLPS